VWDTSEPAYFDRPFVVLHTQFYEGIALIRFPLKVDSNVAVRIDLIGSGQVSGTAVWGTKRVNLGDSVFGSLSPSDVVDGVIMADFAAQLWRLKVGNVITRPLPLVVNGSFDSMLFTSLNGERLWELETVVSDGFTPDNPADQDKAVDDGGTPSSTETGTEGQPEAGRRLQRRPGRNPCRRRGSFRDWRRGRDCRFAWCCAVVLASKAGERLTVQASCALI
jgi:hypothetical protein